jgi:hypothetical protein
MAKITTPTSDEDAGNPEHSEMLVGQENGTGNALENSSVVSYKVNVNYQTTLTLPCGQLIQKGENLGA